jgi:hypothetical protein
MDEYKMITSLSIGKGGLGRFGNQCFTLAGVIGIATKSGQPYGFPPWKNHDNALFGDEVTDFSEVFINKLPEIPEGISFQEYGYFWGYRDLFIPSGNWTIDAHLQDPRYFEHCMPLIRETFRMKDEPAQHDCVAVHFRAGDYIPDPAAYHPRCDMDYYTHAMQQFPAGTKFLIFSDDHEAAKKAIPAYYDCAIYTSNDYLKDFALMKRCKSFICANSSFSYFAALLGEHPEKKIILPRRWFGSSAGLEFDGYERNAIVI